VRYGMSLALVICYVAATMVEEGGVWRVVLYIACPVMLNLFNSKNLFLAYLLLVFVSSMSL
jgi:hypothetical protein